MASRIANGTTVTFGGTAIARVQSIDAPEGGQPIKVTSLDDATELYEDGKPDPSVTIEAIGPPAIARGAKGDLIVTWPDGSHGGTIYNAVCANIDRKGGLNNALAITYTFKPGLAAGS